jgi:hypothetical protein
MGGFIAIEAAPAWYSLIASNIGLVIVGLAATTAFFVGADRMANVFSFFWGTHSIWYRIGNRISNWSESYGERSVPLWVTVALFGILLIIAWLQTS